jgi:CHAT domain-containing protein/tetratricopeptide (TPR) repeat protein
MKYFNTRLFFVLLLLFFYSSTFAQDFSKQRKEAEDKFNEGKINEAISLSEKVLLSAEKKLGKDHPEYAKSLQDLGVYHYLDNDFDKAQQFLDLALEIYTKNPGKNSKEYALCVADYGGILLSGGEYERSEKFLTECKQVLEAIEKNKDTDYAIAVNNLAEVKRALGKVDEAEKLYMVTKGIFESLQLQGSIEYANLLNNIANLFHDVNDYLQAEVYYKKSKDLYSSLVGKESPEYLNVFKNYSLMLLDIGLYEDAKVGVEEVMESYDKMYGKESIEYASCLNDLGNIYYKAANYRNAEKYYLEAKQAKEQLIGDKSPSYWITSNNLALLYNSLGNYQKGLSFINPVLETMKEQGADKSPAYANYLNTRASIYFNKKEFTKSEGDYNSSLEIIKELYGENHVGYSLALNNLAVLYQQQNDFKKAELFYNNSLNILKKDFDNNTIDIAKTSNNLGELYSENKYYEKAEPFFNQALSITKSMFSENHPDYILYLSNLAFLYYRSGQEEKLLNVEKQVQELTLKLTYDVFSFLTESEKILYWKNSQIQFDFYNSFALKALKKHPALISEMFNYSLETKSLIMHHSNLMKKSIHEKGDNRLKEKYESWEAKREKLAGYYNLKKSELKKNNIDLVSLEMEAHELEKQLTAASQEFSNLRTSKKKTWQDVQSKLKANEAAVEIVRVECYGHNKIDSIAYVALIITKETTGNPILVVLRDGEKMEKRYLKSYTNSIKFKTSTSEHYNIYWKQIDKHLQGKEIIYLSPAGVYNKISIPSLKMPDGKFVIETKQIQIITGLRNLLSFHPDNSNKSNTAVLFGFPDYDMDLSQLYPNKIAKSSVINNLAVEDDIRGSYSLNELPGTKIEVEKIYDILFPLGLKVEKYLRNEALESKIKSLNSPKILHIATHGYFLSNSDLQEDSLGITFSTEKSQDNPLLRSGLLLSGANKTLNYTNNINNFEDGILTAYEAMHLNLLHTELVILSACETGLGEETNGEGVFGLQRAFQMAGAKNTLMSLWQVSDEATQELMTLFYKNWALNKNIPVSFRQAQLELMKKYPSPYFWGAFVCVGH